MKEVKGVKSLPGIRMIVWPTYRLLIKLKTILSGFFVI
jgi:hypothetical protein